MQGKLTAKSPRIFGFWAKVRRADPSDQSSPIVAWHTLLDHSADVTAVFRALISLPGFRNRAARYIGRELTVVDIERLCVVVYLHDIGKGNAGFQSKVFLPSERHSSAPAGHVNEACFLISPGGLGICIAHLRILDMEAWFGDTNELFSMLIASWSHHGIPLQHDINALDPALIAAWKPWRWSSPEATVKLFGSEITRLFPLAFTPDLAMKSSPRFEAFFAGLVSLADWIGSSETWFGFDAHMAQDRYEWAKSRATWVLQAMGMDVTASRGALLDRPDGYHPVFEISEPNVMQHVMLSLPLPLPLPVRKGSVVLIESETGSGKTEAAIFHALRYFRAGLVDGFYFALPTRTSGVQIHKRIQKAVSRAFGDAAPSVLLAIPGYTTATDSHSALLCDHSSLCDDAPSPESQWFSQNSKRYLAAPIAAGTIDQVLLSSLRNKHAHMRAASMARSLIIIDEVHASDTYMSRITKEVIRRHVDAGGHVLLMSATLGGEAASDYLSSKLPDLETAANVAYPLIRVSEGHRPAVTNAFHVNGSEKKTKSVRMELQYAIEDDWEVARLAAEHARLGAKVLVIRNTVAACIKTRRALETMLPADEIFRVGIPKVSAPHHGRFAAEDRRLLDEAVEASFGKIRPTGGMVLVATQTVEQSLDIDADVLFSDICPMDVLLQRIGRLHRHLRDGTPSSFGSRAKGYQDPACYVLVPFETLPLTHRSRHGIGLGRAYPDVRITELTVRKIMEFESFVIPTMNRDLVERTVHTEAKSALDREDDAWRVHGNRVSGEIIADKLTAKDGFLPIDDSFGTPAQFMGWGNGKKISTRLGSSPFSAVFAKSERPQSPFGRHKIGVVSIPHWMAPKTLLAQPDLQVFPKILVSTAAGFEFEFAGQQYHYDQDGLRKS
jgi:CRISPR-associated endonuclease/helicase Cas3